MTAFEAPLDLGTDRVRPEWIDYNGHMNVAYYVLAFDYATDRLYDRLGLGHAYFAVSGCSTFTLESHVSYLQEVREGAALRFTGQLLDHDHKRIHWFSSMYHAGEGYLAATIEFLTMHVDMRARLSAPFPAAAMTTLAALRAAHAGLPRPEQAGRAIGIRRASPPIT
ncbi:MAG: thioesterase-like protein [Alphaproteobacteria bacterium]|nr:thioesterase-like protein [Alphaproteobacteria bacterium]